VVLSDLLLLCADDRFARSGDCAALSADCAAHLTDRHARQEVGKLDIGILDIQYGKPFPFPFHDPYKN